MSIANDGSDIINKKIDLDFNLKNNEETLQRYEIDETIEWINNNKFKKVGLQFPDELLPIAVPIQLRLRNKVDCEFGIMSDTSFGGCCVDEVGGEHFNVEAIVHYGNACLTPTHKKLPVRYVFGKIPYTDEYIEMCEPAFYNNIIKSFKETIKDTVCITLLSEHQYVDFSNTLVEKLSKRSDICIHRTLPNTDHYKSNINKSDFDIIGSRIFLKESHLESDCYNKKVIVYICDKLNFAVKSTLLSLFNRTNPIFIFNPVSKAFNDVTRDIEKLLYMRQFKIEAAKNAERVGLLVGTLSMEKYLEIFNYMSNVITKAGKVVYPMIVGKINPQKLTNFVDLDVIVVINCMESCLSFSDKGDGFYKHMVTPYEMICGLDVEMNEKCNISPYITDFRQLLKPENRIDGGNRKVGGEATMSMCTGRIVPLNDQQQESDKKIGSLVLRLDSDWTVSSVDRNSRSWFGLDPNFGKNEVSLIIEGTSGIASGYKNEGI